jgi:uncharacterized protein (TIGR02117 family)
MINALLAIIFSPILFVYIAICFVIPMIKMGKIQKNNGIKIFIKKDAIHSSYVFESKYWPEFDTNEKYIIIGWGDRSIFLETKSWKELKFKNLIKAFFGLNKTALRIEFSNDLQVNKTLEINDKQLHVIKNYIKNSFDINRKIIKKENEYQYGDYYESDLSYNCINTCNNWINQGLRKAKISNRIWCPITFWI